MVSEGYLRHTEVVGKHCELLHCDILIVEKTVLQDSFFMLTVRTLKISGACVSSIEGWGKGDGTLLTAAIFPKYPMVLEEREGQVRGLQSVHHRVTIELREVHQHRAEQQEQSHDDSSNLESFTKSLQYRVTAVIEKD